MGTLVTAAEEGFVPPGPGDFVLPPIFGAVTKPMVLVVASAIILALFFFLASRKLSLVPSKGQFVVESIYNVARNGMAREQIGAHEFKPFIPLVLGLFSFILVNNLFGLIPFIQFPTMSRIGFPVALAIFVYVTYHYAGIRKHGLGGYFKHALFPPGAPAAVYVILAPIEFLSKFVVQPAALFIRVFAAMFAGHLMLMLLAFAGEYLVVEAGGLLSVVGVVSFLGFIVMTFIEALIMVIQAYVFAMLAAVFIGAAVAEEH